MYTFTFFVLSAVINMYACMGCLYDGPTTLATTMIGLKIAPLFNKPFLAESFSSFWGRRWNLCVGLSGSSFTIRYRKVQSDLCCATLLQIQAHLPVPAAAVIRNHVAWLNTCVHGAGFVDKCSTLSCTPQLGTVHLNYQSLPNTTSLL